MYGNHYEIKKRISRLKYRRSIRRSRSIDNNE